MTWSDGFTDGYGLAVRPDGSAYFGQGNTNPSAIHKVPATGGKAQALTTVPMAVVGIEVDPTGPYVYASGDYDGNTLWRIHTDTGAKDVYGCDLVNSKRKCGDTN